ncbi:MAG: ABC transporter permease [Cytophagales bacterium]|jgi:putative ABC transport system permease protein|nr:ABC transporter permease [Cytophagales bacterium]MCA6368452.1 ABC transporter permease [Cytophagales bacterium]MCA6371772.1 ABC transporter permease [Cytophagales bacterium]MCA6376423.1 ABC transporter permease [Cytophagales bacterium]MCA6384971.1 ABC transporter permease [Cytophagales bacterium]
MLTLRLILESLGFAWKALKSNLLRTILSLLGVTIGIFSIIAVLTLVDSLEKNIRDSLNFLGSDVIYVGKWPFTGGNSRDWWKDYIKRPNPSYNEYRFLKANLKNGETVSIFADTDEITVKGDNTSINKIKLTGSSLDYDKLFEINVERGRYFTSDEVESGRSVVILGFEVAQALFPKLENPVGKYVKIKNLRFVIVGVLKREGESFIGNSSRDFSCIIPYDSFRKLYQTGTGRWNENGSDIGLKGFTNDVGLVELENETRGAMRIKRGLKPTQKDNFVLNRPEAVAKAISGVFDVLGTAGWVIGGFSMLVGGFGIANIMFVSVKERTSIIGLQKSLGAKNFFILFQFLFESIFLSLIGGLAGLFLVWLLTLAPFGSLQVVLSVKNIVLGLGVSSVIGLVAGIVPAAMAARLDPVLAIRAN